MGHEHYFEALERLASNKPNILAIGTYKINKDTVALEAGRKRGSIKPSRDTFTELISAIDKANSTYEENENPLNKAKEKAKSKSEEAESYKQKYFSAINREAMLLVRLKELEKENNQLKAESKVIHLK